MINLGKHTSRTKNRENVSLKNVWKTTLQMNVNVESVPILIFENN